MPGISIYYTSDQVKYLAYEIVAEQLEGIKILEKILSYYNNCVLPEKDRIEPLASPNFVRLNEPSTYSQSFVNFVRDVINNSKVSNENKQFVINEVNQVKNANQSKAPDSIFCCCSFGSFATSSSYNL